MQLHVCHTNLYGTPLSALATVFGARLCTSIRLKGPCSHKLKVSMNHPERRFSGKTSLLACTLRKGERRSVGEEICHSLSYHLLRHDCYPLETKGNGVSKRNHKKEKRWQVMNTNGNTLGRLNQFFIISPLDVLNYPRVHCLLEAVVGICVECIAGLARPLALSTIFTWSLAR